MLASESQPYTITISRHSLLSRGRNSLDEKGRPKPTPLAGTGRESCQGR